jgi:hypothetical protein
MNNIFFLSILIEYIFFFFFIHRSLFLTTDALKHKMYIFQGLYKTSR